MRWNKGWHVSGNGGEKYDTLFLETMSVLCCDHFARFNPKIKVKNGSMAWKDDRNCSGAPPSKMYNSMHPSTGQEHVCQFSLVRRERKPEREGCCKRDRLIEMSSWLELCRPWERKQKTRSEIDVMTRPVFTLKIFSWIQTDRVF